MKLNFPNQRIPCDHPNTIFSFVLKFLLWNRNPLTKVCSRCPFYVYSHVFVALNMLIDLCTSSYQLLQGLLKPDPKPESPGDDWVLPVNLWRYQVTIRIQSHHLQLFGALYSVTTFARGLYSLLVVNEYGSLLGWVVTVPVFLALDAASTVQHYRQNCSTAAAPEADATTACRGFLLKRSLNLVRSLLFWSSMCCLLYNRYVNCSFE